MPFSCFKVIIFNHLSDATWECLSSHRPLFHRAGTGSKPEPVPDWAPVLTVGLEPVGSLQNRSQAQDNCPVVAEPYQKEWQHYCQEQRPLLFLHTHTSHVGSHACQGKAQTLTDDFVCLTLTHTEAESLTVPRRDAAASQCSFSRNIETFNMSRTLSDPHLQTTLNPRRQKWNWQSRRQMSIGTLVPTYSTRNHAHNG